QLTSKSSGRSRAIDSASLRLMESRRLLPTMIARRYLAMDAGPLEGKGNRCSRGYGPHPPAQPRGLQRSVAGRSGTGPPSDVEGRARAFARAQCAAAVLAAAPATHAALEEQAVGHAQHAAARPARVIDFLQR